LRCCDTIGPDVGATGMTKDDWYFLITLAVGLIALLGMDWKLVAGRVSMSNQKRQIALLILVCLCVVSSATSWYRLHQIYDRIPYAEYQSPLNTMGAMQSWGGGQFNKIGQPGQTGQSVIKVDGNAIVSYQSDFKVAGLVLHYSGKTDLKDVSELTKTGLYDIAPNEIIMIVDLNQTFLDEMAHGISGTNYIAILVPNDVRLDQFATIRQAEAMGVKVIGRASGPP
jgi:hypothetical protein